MTRPSIGPTEPRLALTGGAGGPSLFPGLWGRSCVLVIVYGRPKNSNLVEVLPWHSLGVSHLMGDGVLFLPDQR